VPLLIDPITDQTRLVSYEKDEERVLAVIPAGVTMWKSVGADSIECLGLNKRNRLNQKRADFWDRCLYGYR